MEDAMFKAGDSVAVKPGVRDHDFDADMGGWQGRVQGIERGQDETLLVRTNPARGMEKGHREHV